MVATVAGRRLTEAHRLRQLEIRNRAISQMVTLWSLLDVTNIDETWTALEPAMMAVLTNGRRQSAEFAGNYYGGIRLVEGITDRFTIPDVATDWEGAALTSLRVTGPIRAKQLLASARPDVAAQTLASITGSLGRHVLNGGREVLLESVRRDRRAAGWARTTDGDPCYFCALLASRGPVYKSERTADFEAHDHCGCGVAPQFSRRDPWPGRSREYRELYNEATAGVEQGTQLQVFRRAYEGRGG